MTSHSSEWAVEVTHEFEAWWETLDADAQESVAVCVELLERRGPRRVAVLLTGGIKTGNDRWYDSIVPRADDLYDAHLESLGHEGRSDG